ALKCHLLWTIRGTGTKIWTVNALMQEVDCTDRDLLLRCCQELADEGLIYAGPTEPPPDLGPAAEGLPSGEGIGNFPPGTIMLFDLPTPTPEQLKEREKLQKTRGRLDNMLKAPANPAAVTPTKPTTTTLTEL